MSAPYVYKVYEPSRIRRGRLSTTPTWFVNLVNGERWKFARKIDATRFVNSGAKCDGHDAGIYKCKLCFGFCIQARSEATGGHMAGTGAGQFVADVSAIGGAK